MGTLDILEPLAEFQEVPYPHKVMKECRFPEGELLTTPSHCSYVATKDAMGQTMPQLSGVVIIYMSHCRWVQLQSARLKRQISPAGLCASSQ